MKLNLIDKVFIFRQENMYLIFISYKSKISLRPSQYNKAICFLDVNLYIAWLGLAQFVYQY